MALLEPAFSSTPPEVSESGPQAAPRPYALRVGAEGAKRGSLLVNVPYLDSPSDAPAFVRPLRVTLFERGARVHWSVKTPAKKGRVVGAKRGRIGDMSGKARIRAAFALGNAPHPWQIMVTLTRREQPADPKADFDKWTRALRRDFDTARQWAWIMEYQGRGVVHHHLFFGADFIGANGLDREWRFERVARAGKETTLVRGPFDDWCVSEWLRATGDYSRECKAFQRGGIVELFRTPDAAARYVAKEAAKRCQKRLPEGVEGGHRWFWLSPAGKPVPSGSRHLKRWPFAVSLGHVFDKSQIEGFLCDSDGEPLRPVQTHLTLPAA